MSSIIYLIIVYVFTFIAGVALTQGKFRRNYLILLTVLVAITAATMFFNVRALFVKQSLETGVRQAVQLPAEKPAEPFTPFYVYQDKPSKNHFAASGFMPDSKCVFVDDAWQVNVKEGRSCIGIVYDVACSRKGRKWAGLYWQNPANNWGAQKGGYNLKGATKLVFWARGHNGGEVIKEFKVGGLGAKQKYPDSTTAVMGPVTLTNEWKEYTIDLRGKDLSYISGGFAWSISADVNSDPCIFYLDEIRFE